MDRDNEPHGRGQGRGVTGRDVHGRCRWEAAARGLQMLRATSLEGLIKRDEGLLGITVELCPHPHPQDLRV